MVQNPVIEGQIGVRVFIDEELSFSKEKTRREIEKLVDDLNKAVDEQLSSELDLNVIVNASLRTVRGINIIDGLDIVTESDVLILPLLPTLLIGVEDVIVGKEIETGAEVEPTEEDVDIFEDEDELFDIITEKEDIIISSQARGKAGVKRPRFDTELCFGAFTKLNDQEVRSHLGDVRKIHGLFTSEIEVLNPDALGDSMTCINTKEETLTPNQFDKISGIIGRDAAFAIAKVNRRAVDDLIS